VQEGVHGDQTIGAAAVHSNSFESEAPELQVRRGDRTIQLLRQVPERRTELHAQVHQAQELLHKQVRPDHSKTA